MAALGGAERSLLDMLASLRLARPAWALHVITPADGPLVEEARSLDVTVEYKAIDMNSTLRALVTLRNPTAAEIENGMSRSQRATMPPVNPSGTAVKTSSAYLTLLNVEKSRRKIRKKQIGTTTVSRCLAATRFSNCPPQTSHWPAGSWTETIFDWASSTNEPRSRPRTLHCTTIRRLPFSRLIWLVPSATSILATLPSGTKPISSIGAPRPVPPFALTRRTACRSSLTFGSGIGSRPSVSILPRRASGSRTTRSKRRSPSNT